MKIIKAFLRGIRLLISRNMDVINRFAEFHETSTLSLPVTISGGGNIYIADHCNINSDAIFYATNAKIIIKKYFIAAKGLQIITGSHERRIGRFCASITESEKNHNIGLDKDVVINEDVWCGMDVTILPNVTVGRGCTIAACSVLSKSTPPYSIWGGVPAKFIKFYWSIDEIIKHEEILYPPNERLSREELEKFFNQYNAI
ncbi:MAG: acyltransferase [Bacteroidales bacterium]|nr:acyltransferase [Bacteroidales bacterium]